MTREETEEINSIKLQALQDTIEQEPTIGFVGFSHNFSMVNVASNGKNFIVPIIVELDFIFNIDSTIGIILREVKNG